ncbi:hypothetical protein LguiA_021834 [Lonicera macranthoides]
MDVVFELNKVVCPPFVGGWRYVHLLCGWLLMHMVWFMWLVTRSKAYLFISLVSELCST